MRQQRPTLNLAAHAYEILSADWCKYNDCVLATASVDKSIKLWDVRAPQQELTTLLGHTCAAQMPAPGNAVLGFTFRVYVPLRDSFTRGCNGKVRYFNNKCRARATERAHKTLLGHMCAGTDAPENAPSLITLMSLIAFGGRGWIRVRVKEPISWGRVRAAAGTQCPPRSL